MYAKTQMIQVLELHRGYDLPERDRHEGNVPIISSAGYSGNHDQYKCDGENVVTGRYGTIGEVFYHEGKCWPLNTALYVSDFKGNYPRYVYYLLKYVLKSATDGKDKSTVPGVDRNVLHQMDIPFCKELQGQKKIVHILADIDRKIETNVKINDNLAQQLRLLYDYWFTQFDFPDENGKPYRSSGGQMVWNDDLKRHIPNFWGCDNLYRIADYVNGLACQKHHPVNGEEALPVIKIKEMHDGITADTELVSANIPSKNIVQPGDILFSWSASLEIAFWFGCTAGLNQHIFKVIPKAPFSREYVYLQLSEYIVQFVRIAESRKTTMGHITSDHLNESRVVIPPIEVIQKFTTIARPIFEELKVCHAEMEHLQNLRDWLLPMLMNGQATISD